MKDPLNPGTLDLEDFLNKKRLSVYLASRYSRRDELLGYAKDLEMLGCDVTSRWVYGEHDVKEDDLDEGDPKDNALRARFAQEDINDLMAARLVICFTERPRHGSTRGGRHVEFGIALATKKMCWVVGHRENIFYCMPSIVFMPDWQTCITHLSVATKAMA